MLGQFAGHRYLALETFRRNGEGVIVPVWFAEDGGKLYIWTISTSGKAKRIRRNPMVRFCPSSAGGRPKGSWVEAHARILNPNESECPIEMIRKKYGIQFWLLKRLHGRDRIIIELTPADSPTGKQEPPVSS